MPRAFSNDLRQRVVNAVLSGQTRREVAKRYDLSYATFVKWVSRFKKTGSCSPAQMGGYRKCILLPYRDFILSILQEKPHTTLHAMQQALFKDFFGHDFFRGFPVQGLLLSSRAMAVSILKCNTS